MMRTRKCNETVIGKKKFAKITFRYLILQSRSSGTETGPTPLVKIMIRLLTLLLSKAQNATEEIYDILSK